MAMSFDKQKTLDFLEANAQWFALGAGVLFMAYMGYSYWLNDPSKVEIGGEAVGPGGVEQKVVAAVDDLKGWRSNPAQYQGPALNIVRDFENKLKTPKPDAYKPLSIAVVPMPRFKFDEFMKPGAAPIVNNDNPGGQTPGGVQMPLSLPAALTELISTGKSHVDPKPLQMVNGVPVPPAPPAQPGVLPVGTKDLFWVRYTFKLPMGTVANEFQIRGVPPGTARSFFLRCELVRQRQLPGGTWGEEAVVPPASFQPLNAFPLNGNPNAQMDYARWAAANQQAIVQPGFYPVFFGDNPNYKIVGEAVLGVANFDPATFRGDESLLSPEQAKQLRDYRAAAAKQKEEERRSRGRAQPQPRGPRGREPGGMPGDMPNFYSPGGDPVAPTGKSVSSSKESNVIYAMQRPDTMAPPPGGMPGDPGMGPVPPIQPQGPTLEALNYPPVLQAPINLLAPDVQQTTAYGWCYDETVKPGEIYRYRVRYYFVNPLRLQQPAAGNAGAAAKLPEYAIIGEDKNAWSDPIEVAPVTHFFVAAPVGGTNQQVRVSIFRWQDGKLHKTQQTLSPGDPIGTVSKDDNIDYRTGWTVADVRRDNVGGEGYALVMASDGRTDRRAESTDKTNQTRIRLELEMANPQPAPGDPNNPNAGAMPGGYPGGGYPGGYPGGPGGMVPPAN
ncbi:MAG: hypothetical protein QM770_14035 [Tepidisphaeraceae bacterium]